jgi:hypothetical protein
MKKAHSLHHRHFPYQYPTFGTDKTPKPKSAWECSVYYWWWEYLRRSEDYLKCCENGGKGKCSKVYKDFGDIRTKTFKRWWLDENRGVSLFAQESLDDTVRILSEGEKASNPDEFLTISFPINLPKKLLEKRFKAIIDESHKGSRGRQLAKKAKAKYLFTGQPNIEGLRTALRVYDFAKENPHLKLWEIGNELPKFQLSNKTGPKDPDFDDKKNRLGATVKRYLTRVEKRIQSVALGQFP